MLEAVFSTQGANIHTADDGAVALDLLRQVTPDIILLDIVLPTVDGLTILKKLRDEGNQTPIILLTDRTLVDDKVDGLNLGADDYITKPFSTKELLARIHAQLRRTGQSEYKTGSKAVIFGNLKINENVREVFSNHSESLIQLTKTEYDILIYLVRNRDRIVEYGELLVDVLHYHSSSETKTLVMHIANLRKKLNNSGDPGLAIKAVPGLGYRIVEQ